MKSSFIVNKGKTINLYDNNILSILKLNKDGLNEISVSNKSEFIGSKRKSYQDLLINTSLENVPNFKVSKKPNYFVNWSILLIFFILLNGVIIYSTYNPYISLKLNYYFSQVGLKKIDNSAEIMQAEKLMELDGIIESAYLSEVMALNEQDSSFSPAQIRTEILRN